MELTTKPDVVCEHGVAMDVHCCGCHGGFLFDVESCACLGEPDGEGEQEPPVVEGRSLWS